MAQEKNTSKSLLYSCLVVTVVLHLAFVTYLFRHPLFFQPSFATAWTRGMHHDQADVAYATKTKSLVLHEALSHIVLLSPQETQPSLRKDSPSDSTIDPKLQQEIASQLFESTLSEKAKKTVPIDNLFSSTATVSFPNIDESVLSSHSSFSNTFPSLPQAPLSSSVHFEPPTLHSEPFLTDPSALISSAIKEARLETTTLLYNERASDEIFYLPTGYEERSASIFSKKHDKDPREPLIASGASIPLIQKNPLRTQGAPDEILASIESYLPEEPGLSFSDWSDYFHLDTVFLPHEENQEYRFALTLSPKDDLSSIRMKQNFYFLIDRSNSIEKHRFSGYKRAVMRALDMLTTQQTFNICIFDRKTEALAKTPLIANEKNIHEAKQYLESKEYSGAFSAGELYNTLTKLIPPHPTTTEMHIAILLSDGNSSLSNQKQKEALNHFLKKNHKQLSLYAATCGRGNDLTLLKVLTTQTGGEVLFSPTHAAFARKFARYVRTLRSPLAKEISTTLSTQDKQIKVKLLTPSNHLPSLYNHIPYTLYGAVSEPTTITIAIEGLHKQQPIVIQKEITFERPVNKSPQLEKEWLEQLALNQWGKYLKTGKKEDLKRAKSYQEEAATIQLRKVRSQ